MALATMLRSRADRLVSILIIGAPAALARGLATGSSLAERRRSRWLSVESFVTTTLCMPDETLRWMTTL